MDVKFVGLLLMNSLVVGNNCQSTTSYRNEAIHEFELLEDMKSELQSIRQMLMKLQETAVRNEKQAIQDMKSEIKEIRQIVMKQENRSGNGLHAVERPFVYAKHSQSDRIPGCPTGFSRLWDGYSLLHTEDNGKFYGQDLGLSGSCMAKFSSIPFMRCTISNVCKYADLTATSYWLSANSSIPQKPVKEDELSKFVSRCSVCQAPAQIITIHSQSSTIPSCPYHSGELWSGYSFVMHSIGGQQLASSGSCLETYRANAYIECNSRGQCHFFHDKFSYWLVSLGEGIFHTNVVSFEVKDNEVLGRVSRCKVCANIP